MTLQTIIKTALLGVALAPFTGLSIAVVMMWLNRRRVRREYGGGK